jgi:hypothetical protein
VRADVRQAHMSSKNRDFRRKTQLCLTKCTFTECLAYFSSSCDNYKGLYDFVCVRNSVYYEIFKFVD